MMVERYLLKRHDYPALTNNIKIPSDLDIGEKRIPQDDGTHFKLRDEQFDIRVSVLSTRMAKKWYCVY
jgi:general secretion pathway protein E/type IV pilus assembly protein PilB